MTVVAFVVVVAAIVVVVVCGGRCRRFVGRCASCALPPLGRRIQLHMCVHCESVESSSCRKGLAGIVVV